MKTAAVSNGMDANLARKIINMTMIGCGTLLESSKVNPIQLVDQISSPAGTTIHGLRAMQKANVSSGISDAIDASVKRAKQLSSMISQGGDSGEKS